MLISEPRCRYFLTGNLADSEEEVIRISGLLRGTESAAQAVSVRYLHLPGEEMRDFLRLMIFAVWSE